MKHVVLDAEAVQALLQPGHSAREHVLLTLAAAQRRQWPVVVAAVTLAELYRGRMRSHSLDALLARHDDIEVCDTDRSMARVVGGLLERASMGSEHLADAHVAALAIGEGGVILTSDPNDLNRLVAGIPHVTVVGIT